MSSVNAKNNSIEINPKAKLSEFTTFRLGGCARGLINCRTIEELVSAVHFLNEKKEQFILIGGGSNLVVSDQGLDHFVIRFHTDEPLVEDNQGTLSVTASTRLDDLVLYAAEQGLSGLNYCSGIPGTVGGAIVGNAGAFGKQIGDALLSVTLLNRIGDLSTASPEALKFKYRHSILKETQDIVVEAKFKVGSANRDKLLSERRDILSIRKEKHPDLSRYPCAGSFFRNIEPTSKAGRRQATGWFLDQAGGKSLAFGGAAIYPKHANIIIKTDHCTAEDVFQLSQQMTKLAKEIFDLDLVREVRFVGDFIEKPAHIQDIIW